MKNKKILILTPDKVFNEILEESLMTAGMKPISASTIAEATKKIKENKNFDLSIIDCPYDEHYGFEVMVKSNFTD